MLSCKHQKVKSKQKYTRLRRALIANTGFSCDVLLGNWPSTGAVSLRYTESWRIMIYIRVFYYDSFPGRKEGGRRKEEGRKQDRKKPLWWQQFSVRALIYHVLGPGFYPSKEKEKANNKLLWLFINQTFFPCDLIILVDSVINCNCTLSSLYRK